MRSKRLLTVVLVGIVTALVLAPVQAATAGALPPVKPHPLGHSMVEWQQIYQQWSVGSSDNPVFTDACGTLTAGAFLVAPPTRPEGERHCQVPTGTMLVASPAMVFSEIPTYGSNDDEIVADAAATWDLLDFSHAVLDGKELRLGDGVATGAWTLTVEAGSFYDLVFEGTADDWDAGDSVRLATQGQVIVIPPLKPGVHELQLVASFANGAGYFNETMVLHVG